MIYRVYADQKRHVHVVKRGFSWPAFLSPEIWLFLRGLPVDAVLAIGLIITGLVMLPPDFAGLSVLAVRIAAGIWANRRIEARFRSQGWQRVEEVHARSVFEAVSKASGVPAPAA